MSEASYWDPRQLITHRVQSRKASNNCQPPLIAPANQEEKMAASAKTLFNYLTSSASPRPQKQIAQHLKVCVSKHNAEPIPQEPTNMQQVLSTRYPTIPVTSAHYSMHTMHHQSQVFHAKHSHLKINHNAALFTVALWMLA